MQFSKMHGLGNDFMVVDAVTQNAFFSPELIRRLADRHLGVGFDQLLVVEPPYDPELDFSLSQFSMLMAVKWRSAATVARCCPVLCA